MKSQMKYNRITDRACYNTVATVNVTCLIKSKNNKPDSFQTKIKNALEKQIERHFSDISRIPYTVINKMKCKLIEHSENNNFEDKIQTVKIQCMIDMTFEEIENQPDCLMKAITNFLIKVGMLLKALGARVSLL